MEIDPLQVAEFPGQLGRGAAGHQEVGRFADLHPPQLLFTAQQGGAMVGGRLDRLTQGTASPDQEPDLSGQRFSMEHTCQTGTVVVLT